MKQITPDEVLKAITENNLTPHQGWFVEISTGKECVCGLTALVIGMGNKFGFVNAFDDPENFILNTLIKDGFEKDYLIGFVHGFDGRKLYSELSAESIVLGVKDGIAAWEAVKHLAIQNESEEKSNV